MTMPNVNVDTTRESVAEQSARLVGWYWAEARRCWERGARFGFAVMTAAAMEAALIAGCALEEDRIRALKRPSSDRHGWPSGHAWKWDLETLVDGAIALDWAGVWEDWATTPPPDEYADLGRLLHTLRDVRNWLHPERLIRRGTVQPGVVTGLQLGLAAAFLLLMRHVWPLLEANGIAIVPLEADEEPVFPLRIRAQEWEMGSVEG